MKIRFGGRLTKFSVLAEALVLRQNPVKMTASKIARRAAARCASAFPNLVTGPQSLRLNKAALKVIQGVGHAV
jgi:hypothetical protein